MRCPRDYSRCGKFNTVRHCPGCPLWNQAKETRNAKLREMKRRASEDATAPALDTSVSLYTGIHEGDGQLKTETAKFPEARGYQNATRVDGPSYAGGSELSFWDKPERDKVLYTYDGSLNGFFCCVYESYYLKEAPISIRAIANSQPAIIEAKDIYTEREKALKVKTAIKEKISEEALDLIETVFLSCLEQKELRALRFLVLAFKEGPGVMNMLGHPDVAPLIDAEKHLLKEAHLLKGFIRFSDTDGVLTSNITPKNFILPFIANHFCLRYADEQFIIYDKAHKAGLFYQNGKRVIAKLDEMPFPEADEKEARYRDLWKRFYHTIAIEARINPKCRMTHMPKRYWENMTEMAELL